MKCIMSFLVFQCAVSFGPREMAGGPWPMRMRRRRCLVFAAPGLRLSYLMTFTRFCLDPAGYLDRLSALGDLAKTSGRVKCKTSSFVMALAMGPHAKWKTRLNLGAGARLNGGERCS